MTGASNERLFYEPGASWAWLLAGPAAGGGMLAIQISAGYGWQPLLPALLLVLVSGFLTVQVKAARIHTSVELTPEALRQGAEITKVSEIVTVYPPTSGSEMQNWQSARALGELTGVPRGRTGIGLKLSGNRTAQAWARRHATLREELAGLVEERVP
ncbi:membrane protein [Mycolicibacterium doricum]|uniref:Membrane protein n=1 Tax=Mycolicibacterium doricum TaxID=126673 RepID=A0A1X1T152_9MYCO|nr:DUF3093 domain-containing protein [Mycolicibacterium doricum]MCV7269303.1 DUF3093 domain-containing protein [Mycolicibacterium doricum]ORV37986.1 hypothetical protein AWC01_15230 [Mycolicibacterium doricum]BBZ06193.1 membrane protein [Mycolicibacterium doricum]